MNTAAHFHIDPAPLDRAIDPHTRTVLDLLLYFRIPTRIVGGAVRDLLLGKEPRDIDLVADADPAVLIYLFEGHGIPVDLGGIQHGTVKAVFGHGDSKEKVDVSSLGYRIQRHGHHFEAGGTHSWRVDSELRDLTINSMSMDTHGRVYDYLNGARDLRNQTVRMAPHSQDSFVLDPNSIMRYFKAVSMFDHPRLLRKDLNWIKQNVHHLADVADDQRVQMNLISILKSSNRQQTLDLMCSAGVGRYLPFLPCS
jgi:tRNA nucleotidyltransferase/poly(A) polymerase